MKGLVHIYCGDGKGKSTAAIGLAIRCAGCGGHVLYASFLKDNSSGERAVLSCIESTEEVLEMDKKQNTRSGKSRRSKIL